jgi:hypothetical protein
MPDNTAQNQTPASTASFAEQLKGIVKGDINKVMKNPPIVIPGNKIRNEVLRNLVKIYRDKGLTADTIIEKLLAFDESVEKGLIDEAKMKAVKEKPEDVKKIFKFAN